MFDIDEIIDTTDISEKLSKSKNYGIGSCILGGLSIFFALLSFIPWIGYLFMVLGCIACFIGVIFSIIALSAGIKQRGIIGLCMSAAGALILFCFFMF